MSTKPLTSIVIVYIYIYMGKLEYFTNLNFSAIWGWFPLLTRRSQWGRSEVVISYPDVHLPLIEFRWLPRLYRGPSGLSISPFQEPIWPHLPTSGWSSHGEKPKDVFFNVNCPKKVTSLMNDPIESPWKIPWKILWQIPYSIPWDLMDLMGFNGI